MRIEWFMACAGVTKRTEGGWDIQGAGADLLTIHSFPTEVQFIACFMFPHDRQTHGVTIEHVDPDGVRSMGGEINFTLGSRATGLPANWEHREVAPFGLRLHQAVEGVHTFTMTVDGTVSKDLQLLVRIGPKPPARTLGNATNTSGGNRQQRRHPRR